MANIGIIGSGFGGLSAACYLARDGHKVTVYEKNDQLGGRASVLSANGFRWDMGPSWYLMPDLFAQFFSDFGEEVDQMLMLQKLSPSYKIFFKDTNHIVNIYDTIEKNALTFEMLEPGSVEKLKDYLQKAKYQYEVAMRDFVPKNYDSIFDFFTWRMMTEGHKLHVFSKMDKYVARYFKTPEMQKIMQYPLVFLGTSPSDAPALYNIMSRVDFGMGVYYPQGGIYAVIDAIVSLCEKYGVRFHTNTPVNKIMTEAGTVKGLLLDNETEVLYDAVISNADMWWTETHMLDKLDQSYANAYWSKKTMAPSGFIVYLGIKGHMKSLEHHSLIFCQDRAKNFQQIFRDHIPPTDPSLYICCPSKTDPTTAPEGYENMFILVPFPPGVYFSEAEKTAYKRKIYHIIEESIGEKFVDRIVEEHLFTVEDFEQRYNAYKGSALGLAHTFNQTAIFRPNNISKKVKNLYYAGGYTNPGIGMPMCLISGKLVAERIQHNKSLLNL